MEDTIKQRKDKYTPEYYFKLKKTHGFKWEEVPFTCHQCGKVFHRKYVKPKSLPVNCSTECRAAAFDPSISDKPLERIEKLNWDKIMMLLNSGKTGPQIAKVMGISLLTLHRHLKKKKGVKALNKLFENGVRHRNYQITLAAQERAKA